MQRFFIFNEPIQIMFLSKNCILPFYDGLVDAIVKGDMENQFFFKHWLNTDLFYDSKAAFGAILNGPGLFFSKYESFAMEVAFFRKRTSK